MDIVGLEERLDRQLQRPGVTDFAAVRTAAAAWPGAVWAVATPVRRWVEKTPTNERFVSRLMAEFPEAKPIHVVRHPLAVYASHQRAARDHGRRSVRPASDAYLLLRYEDLLEDTAGTVQHMASFLGIEALPVLMQPTANGIPTPSNSSFSRDETAGRLNTRPLGDAFGVLTWNDRERLGTMLAGAAGNPGYPLPRPPAWRRTLLRMQMQAEWVADRLKARWTRYLSLR